VTPAAAGEERARDAAAVVAGLVLIALGVAAVLAQPSGPPVLPDFSLHTWIPDEAALARARADDARLLATLELDADAREVLSALQDFHAAEVETGGSLVGEEVRRTHTWLEQTAVRYTSARGIEPFRALGLHARNELGRALFALANRVRRSGQRMDDALDADPPPEDLALARALGGTFIEEAIRSGILRPDGSWSDGADAIIPALFMGRWALWVRTLHPAQRVTTPHEQLTLAKWKIEAHRSLPLERRLELLREVDALDERYPTWRVAASLYVAAERWDKAAIAIALAIIEDPDNSVLRANRDFILAHLGPGPS
jgi:hypothetical protein